MEDRKVDSGKQDIHHKVIGFVEVTLNNKMTAALEVKFFKQMEVIAYHWKVNVAPSQKKNRKKNSSAEQSQNQMEHYGVIRNFTVKHLVYPSIYPSIYIFIHLSIFQPACVPVCLSICMSVCLSIYLITEYMKEYASDQSWILVSDLS